MIIERDQLLTGTVSEANWKGVWLRHTLWCGVAGAAAKPRPLMSWSSAHPSEGPSWS